MFKKAKENKKGFTLAELLIVVAIIAVLVRLVFRFLRVSWRKVERLLIWLI